MSKAAKVRTFDVEGQPVRCIETHGARQDPTCIKTQ